jgi:hypothetical protein
VRNLDSSTKKLVIATSAALEASRKLVEDAEKLKKDIKRVSRG